MFTPATRRRSRMRIALCGSSGSGKTRGALALAAGMGKRIAVLDTERGGAELYAGEFAFDVQRLEPPFATEAFVRAIRAAEGYDVLVLDSLSRPWSGPGGVLEAVARNRRADVKYPWSEPGAGHEALLAALRACPCHVVSTMRSRTVWERRQVREEPGRRRLVKAGVLPEQRSDMGYEFMVLLYLGQDGRVERVVKDVTGLFSGLEGSHAPVVPGLDVGRRLLSWTRGDVPVESGLERAIRAVRACCSVRELARLWAGGSRDMRQAGDTTWQELFQRAVAQRLGELARSFPAGSAGQYAGGMSANASGSMKETRPEFGTTNGSAAGGR